MPTSVEHSWASSHTGYFPIEFVAHSIRVRDEWLGNKKPDKMFLIACLPCAILHHQNPISTCSRFFHASAGADNRTSRSIETQKLYSTTIASTFGDLHHLTADKPTVQVTQGPIESDHTTDKIQTTCKPLNFKIIKFLIMCPGQWDSEIKRVKWLVLGA